MFSALIFNGPPLPKYTKYLHNLLKAEKWFASISCYITIVSNTFKDVKS